MSEARVFSARKEQVGSVCGAAAKGLAAGGCERGRVGGGAGGGSGEHMG